MELTETKEHGRIKIESEEDFLALCGTANPLIEAIDPRTREAVLGFYVGLHWLIPHRTVLHVVPKVDSEFAKVDYFKMLSGAFDTPGRITNDHRLFNIAFDQPEIRIEKEKDVLTPLIVFQFLHTLHDLVKKGLNNGYYKTRSTLVSRIKGKILVGENIKRNVSQNRILNTLCEYDTFGIDYPENRVIKKALHFALRYLKSTEQAANLEKLLHYVKPAFERVSESVMLQEVSPHRVRSFQPGHRRSVELAVQLLRRFGTNIQSVDSKGFTSVHPFWINMPFIFELYVLSKLQDSIGAADLLFQAHGNSGYPDFLRTTSGKELVIDSKYKIEYVDDSYLIEDIRQVSAYARDRGVLEHVGIKKDRWKDTVLNCLIIFPDQNSGDIISENDLLRCPVRHFEKIYKLGIAVPTKPKKRSG